MCAIGRRCPATRAAPPPPARPWSSAIGPFPFPPPPELRRPSTGAPRPGKRRAGGGRGLPSPAAGITAPPRCARRQQQQQQPEESSLYLFCPLPTPRTFLFVLIFCFCFCFSSLSLLLPTGGRHRAAQPPKGAPSSPGDPADVRSSPPAAHPPASGRTASLSSCAFIFIF